jgi:hypothetical protein
MLGEIRVLAGEERPDKGCPKIVGQLGDARRADLPERRPDDVAVQSLIRPIGQLG